MRMRLERIGERTFWLAVVWIVLGAFISWLFGIEPVPAAPRSCTYVINLDQQQLRDCLEELSRELDTAKVQINTLDTEIHTLSTENDLLNMQICRLARELTALTSKTEFARIGVDSCPSADRPQHRK